MSAPVPSTAVPFPVLGDRGFVAPDEQAILVGVSADLNAAFGGNLNPQLSSPQGQIASSETAIIGDSFAMFALFCNLVDPAYSSGRMQDAIARIYFITRIPGAATLQPCICTGLSGVIIPVGALAIDTSGTLWVCQEQGTIALNGNVTLNFACQNIGPTAGPASLTIYQAIPGWDTVAPSGGATLGRLAETPSQFEARRSASTGLNSMGPLNAIYAAVAAVANVLDVYATQNNTGSPVTIGGVSIAAHSIYIAVVGGLSTDIALAIFSRKMPGCGMVGNTTVSVADPNPAYQPPVPTYSITFEIPTGVTMAVVVTIANSPQVPSNATVLVQNAIISGFAGTDGGSRAKIGSTVFASRYYGDVAGISNTFNGTTGQSIPGWSAAIISIQVGINGAAATFTGSISGSTLTVSAIASGTLAVGQLIQDNNAPSHIAANTIITAQLTGSPGGTGTYSVNVSQTVTSETMTATTLSNDVTLNINQYPTVQSSNIYLILT